MRTLYYLLAAVTLLGGSAAAWILPGLDAPAEVAAPDPGQARRQAIAFYERRLTEDPQSALDMAQLAGLLMDEGRLRGDERAFVQAESLARRSLSERTRRNGRSAALLANSLLAQHRFTEAIDVARDLVRSEPDEPAYRALLAETLMETGDYAGAIAQLGSIRAHRAELGIAPRFARWSELTGQTAKARQMLRETRDEAERRVDLTAERRAWFSLRLADFELRHGNARAAGAAISAGLRTAPADWRLRLAEGRLAAAVGDWRQALRSAEAVIADVASPEAFALLASAHRALGRHNEAVAYETALEGIARRQAGGIHRGLALALLDEGRAVDDMLRQAAADTLVRRDVHTLDLLAWALYRAGRPSYALPLARRALHLGTVEPVLRYHAGLIELAAGNDSVGREHLRVAQRGSRALSLAQVSSLRRALKTPVVARTR